MLITVSAYKIRQNFGEFLERSFYRGTSFLIKRGKKPMAYLIGRPFLAAYFEVLEKDAGLADTMALVMNKEAKEMIDKGLREGKAGKKFKLDKLLD